MALTAYQLQYKRRMLRAISLRARADAKARRYTKLLSDAIGEAELAAMQLNELNQIYNVDVSTYTILTQALHANSGQEVLEDHLAQSTPGEEVVIFNQVPDANGVRQQFGVTPGLGIGPGPQAHGAQHAPLVLQLVGRQCHNA